MVKMKMMKRIYKEIKLLEDYYGKDKVEVSTFLGNEQHEYVINIYKNKCLFCNVKVMLCNDYPFKEPSLCLYSLDKSDNKNIIRTIKYFDFFAKCSLFYYIRNGVELEDYLCPCCYHAMCNRQLNESLLELSKDVEKFGVQFMRLREKYFLKRCIQKKNNLHEDSLNIILSFI
jgi:hypothetical protein